MALREDQVLRYSRQILLAEVGGVGQERLLGHAFLLVGAGAAQETAAAYLAAAGCGVAAGPQAVGAAEVGFLLSTSDVGGPRGGALEAGLRALNPDAVPGETTGLVGELGEVPARFAGEGCRVALGLLGEGAGVAYAAAGACSACFAEAVRPLRGGLGAALSVEVGSLAALVAQRLVLGLSVGVGLLSLDAHGGLGPSAEPRCGRCT